jgi:hypothetical protein
MGVGSYPASPAAGGLCYQAVATLGHWLFDLLVAEEIYTKKIVTIKITKGDVDTFGLTLQEYLESTKV